MAFANAVRTYAERRIIGYSRQQLFDVVAAVENYYLFVPACRKSQVIQRSKDSLKAHLEIGIPPLLESYTSHVKLDRPNLVTAACIEGHLFKHLDTRWKFSSPKARPPPSLETSAYSHRKTTHINKNHVGDSLNDLRKSSSTQADNTSIESYCILDFYVSFEFKTFLYAKLAAPIFDEMVRLNVSAFLKRAETLYGPEKKVHGVDSKAVE